MKAISVITTSILLLAAPAMAQVPPVKNPTGLEFTCPDHATDTGHEVDVINSSGTIIQTLAVGDPAEVAGKVTVKINVQPITFGTYTFKVRALAGPIIGQDSVASDPWERVPGPPSKPVVTP